MQGLGAFRGRSGLLRRRDRLSFTFGRISFLIIHHIFHCARESAVHAIDANSQCDVLGFPNLAFAESRSHFFVQRNRVSLHDCRIFGCLSVLCKANILANMVETLEEPKIEPAWAPPLSPKQFDILNNKKRVTLVTGPRRTGKSIAVGHKVCRHLWDVEAKVGIFVTSYKVGTHGGSWADLIDICLPAWLASGLVSDDEQGTFEYLTMTPEGVPGPRHDGKTRTPLFSIRNRHGTESTCTLYSIDNENEIEAKTKQLRFSMVWIVELSTFKSAEIYKMTEESLRWGPDEDQQWISDTNPSEDGTTSWIYKEFYEKRNKPPDEMSEDEKRILPNMCVFELYEADNPFAHPDRFAALRVKYSDDPDGYARHVEGRWIRASKRSGFVFADVLNEHVHVIKDSIDVDKNTSMIYTGWDPGIFNSAAVALEKRMIGDHAFWFVLDELVSVDHEVNIADFAVGFFEKMVALNNHYKSQWPGFQGFQWEHWSDPNVATLTHPSLTGAASAEIEKVTGGQIELNAAIKGAGSVESGCNFIRRLLREERLFIGENCPNLLEALRKVKKGGTRGDFIDRNDKYKHVLDCLRYPLTMLSIEELDETPRRNSSTRPIIQVKL